MFLAILCGLVAMDIEELQKDIFSAYDADPAVQSFCADPKNMRYSQWSEDDVGFIWID